MKVYLRALELEDYKKIHSWRSDKRISSQLAGNVFFVSTEREKKSIESKIFNDRENLYLAICEIDTNKMIGFCSINNIDLRNLHAEWGGTLIGPEHIGKSYGIESARLLIDYLFEQYPIHKCKTSCLENHPATPKLFSKLGFKKEGVLRNEVFKDGEFKNIALFSLLRSEYKKNV